MQMHLVAPAWALPEMCQEEVGTGAARERRPGWAEQRDLGARQEGKSGAARSADFSREARTPDFYVKSLNF